MDHQNHPGLAELQASFPKSGKYRGGPWSSQSQIMEFVARHGSSLVESPTGSGKTAVEYAILKAAEKRLAEQGSLFWIAPNKTIVEQIRNEFPEIKVVYGQNEHVCPWAAEDFESEPAVPLQASELPILYEDPKFPRVDEIPHLMHKRCPHYVDSATGQTLAKDVVPCPYYQQKYEATRGGIVLSTMSFHLFTHLFGHHFGKPAALVIDEVHRIADVIRSTLSYDITDWHLSQAINLLMKLETSAKKEIKVLKKFLRTLKHIAKARKRQPQEETLLTEEEIRRLIAVLDDIDPETLLQKIERAVDRGLINAKAERVTLRKLETLVLDIRRYIHSFEYSLEEKNEKGETVRAPLNYTCAFYRQSKSEYGKVQYKLIIRCHYVAPLIKKCLLAPFTVSFSATIGNPEVFSYESGIKHSFLSLGSNFPSDHTRLYIPTDTPNLAMKARSQRDLPQTLRKIAKACVRFARQGHRCLVVTISNLEREKFLKLADEEGLITLSYGNGVTAKEIALAFREGEGDCLVGTAANYAEGLDLPKQIAPIIFFLRPGYPNPRHASTQFEEKRFGGARWAIWNWRVMHQALQVRGRNIRSRSDVGVTFFVSQQFRRILYAALPQWLEPAYRNCLSFESAVEDAEKLLSS